MLVIIVRNFTGHYVSFAAESQGLPQGGHVRETVNAGGHMSVVLGYRQALDQAKCQLALVLENVFSRGGRVENDDKVHLRVATLLRLDRLPRLDVFDAYEANRSRVANEFGLHRASLVALCLVELRREQGRDDG